MLLPQEPSLSEMVNFRQKRNTISLVLERKIQAWFPFQVVKYFKGTTLLRRQCPSETAFQIPKVKVAWGVLNSQPFAIANSLRSHFQVRKHGPVVERMVQNSALDSGLGQCGQLCHFHVRS